MVKGTVQSYFTQIKRLITALFEDQNLSKKSLVEYMNLSAEDRYIREKLVRK